MSAFFICETTAEISAQLMSEELLRTVEIHLNSVTNTVKFCHTARNSAMINYELKMCTCTDELQTTIHYLDCCGQNIIFNDQKK